MFKLKVEYKDFSNITRSLSYMSRTAKGPSNALRKASGIVYDSIMVNFNTESSGYPNRTPWKELAPRTVEERRRELGDAMARHPILYRTGRLKRSVTKPQVSKNIMTVRATAPYASKHIEGTEKVPRRDFLLVDANTLDGVMLTILNEVSNRFYSFR